MAIGVVSLALVAPGAASAAERYVAVDGDDASNDCLVEAAPCATIGYAVGEADPGDAVQVAAGAYAVDATVVADKAVTIAGAQAGVDARNRELPADQETIVSPGPGITGSAPLIRLSAPGATVDGLTIEGHAQAGVQTMLGSSGYAVRNSILTDNEVGVDLETTDVDAEPTVIERNRFEGNNRPTLQSGIYGDGTAQDVTIRANRFLGHTNVPINISGATTTQRDLFIAGNTFENERHLLLLDVDGVEIAGNTFVDGRSQAISVEGGVQNLSISGNTITGADNAGIIFFDRYGAGPNGTTTITGNTITATTAGDLPGAPGAGIDVSNQHSDDPGYAGTLNVSGNRIVGNAGGGVMNAVPGATVEASDNWWGCNAGPGGAGCDTISGTVNASPHVVLSAAASPPQVGINGASTVFAALNTNSAGQSVAGLPDGIPVQFSTALGSIAPTSTTLQAGGATASFTAGSQAGSAGANVTVDNQTLPVALTITQPTPPVEPTPPAKPAPPVEPTTPRPPSPPAVRKPKGKPAIGPHGQVAIAVVTC